MDSRCKEPKVWLGVAVRENERALGRLLEMSGSLRMKATWYFPPAENLQLSPVPLPKQNHRRHFLLWGGTGCIDLYIYFFMNSHAELRILKMAGRQAATKRLRGEGGLRGRVLAAL